MYREGESEEQGNSDHVNGTTVCWHFASRHGSVAVWIVILQLQEKWADLHIYTMHYMSK
jgi:hypothetical protein